MAYDENLAERIREFLVTCEGVTERKMFGGLAFMFGGNMFCGIVKADLMVRVGPENHDALLTLPGARPMDFTGRPMKGMLFVSLPGYETDESLHAWLNQALRCVRPLPRKNT